MADGLSEGIRTETSRSANIETMDAVAANQTFGNDVAAEMAAKPSET
jgi:hypothetical protein